jgi:hypothetical protein
MNLTASPFDVPTEHHSAQQKGDAAMWIVALALAGFTGATLYSLLMVIWDSK